MFGRSNVGKSSLINSLLHRLEAAYVSKTPGKTQQLFFYKLNDPKKPIYLVDAPGYGFSSGASKK
jgi:GTP-binding protein